MKRNLTVLLVLLLALGLPLPNSLETIAIGNRSATAAEPVPSQPVQQAPQLYPAQPGFGPGSFPGYPLMPLMAMGGMTGMSGQAATNPEQASPQPLQSAPQNFPTQPAIGQGAWQGYQQAPMTGMGGMGCMGGMSGMGGMGNMMGGGMNMSASGMGHNMDQGLTMREVLYIMSMQDALQAITDMIQVQEKLMGSVSPAERESIRQELKRIKEKTRKIAMDYRGVLSGQLRSE
jgi:hypothetical protein